MSNLPLFTAGQKEDLIQDVVVRSLMVNEDPRGILVETLRTDWHDVYHDAQMPFAQCYYSITNPGVARDEDQWHVHQHQADRFLCLSGQLVVAIFDSRPASLTAGRLNLFHIGPEVQGNGHLLVLIPRQTMHGFLVVGSTPATLLNYPTRLYNPDDEGRVPFEELGALLPRGIRFTWQIVRDQIGQ